MADNVTNSASALDKFAEKIDFTKLEGKPEDFYKAGIAFIEKGQFDDGISEFVKIIKTISHEDPLFIDSVKELKSMGFSDVDIRAISGTPKSPETVEDLVVKRATEEKVKIATDNIQNNARRDHIFLSIIYIGIIFFSSPLILWSLVYGYELLIGAIWAIVSIIVSKILIENNNVPTAKIVLFSAPLVAWLLLAMS